MGGIAAIKRNARLAIQALGGEPCTYSDGENPTVPTLAHQAAGLTLTARFHTKAKMTSGAYDGLTVMEPIEKLVFNQGELEALGLELQQGAEVFIPAQGVALVLDSPLDADGPENVYWTVTRA